MAPAPSARRLSDLPILKAKKQVPILWDSAPYLFAIGAMIHVALFNWPMKWLISGAPVLTFVLLLGTRNKSRVLSIIPLWTLIATINLAYSICATSWLLYDVYTILCYPAIFIVCLFQFEPVGYWVRRGLRVLLKNLQFIDDKIAFFDLPALEIDTDVGGLMVVRGITISLSTLTIVAHGIEVGMKLSPDLELAIQCEEVVVPLFRRINIGDIFANIKGGELEMTFGHLKDRTSDDDGNQGAHLMIESNTPLLQAAARTGDTSRPPMVKMTSRMTNGTLMTDSSALSSIGNVRGIFPEQSDAGAQYNSTLNWIRTTNNIAVCREAIREVESAQDATETNFDYTNPKDVRAAICSQLHDMPSIPHPPPLSVKVTTLQNMSPPWARNLMHRMPMLLRLLLNPLSYFHPVFISSITAAGSGKWLTSALKEKVFAAYGEDNREIRRLEASISAWLSSANFCVELDDITGLAQVPFISKYEIKCSLAVEEVLAYRTLPEEVDLAQVARIGGADAVFKLPTFLLPHHEHLLPAKPTSKEKDELREKEDELEMDGTPKALQNLAELEKAAKDECQVQLSVHARLPAKFDQSLLNFVAALVKATKVIELEKEPSAMDVEVGNFGEFAKALKGGFKEGVKKMTAEGILNDRLVARLVGKAMRRVERMQGEVGYSGGIPVALGPYREAEGQGEGAKLLG